jgi:hypothetical protein
MVFYFDRNPDLNDDFDKADAVAAARLAAERLRPSFSDLGASPAQVSGLVEAFRLVLVDEPERARDALIKAEFSPDQVELIFPQLLAGLQRAA